MKKIFVLLLLFILIPNFCFADEIDEELDDVVEVSVNINEKELNVNSKNVAVIDRKTLTVLFEKNAYEEVAMASTTKIMTAIIVIENCEMSDMVEISRNSAMVTGSTLGVHVGDKMSVNDLLYGLMMRSGNDCAVALAEHVSRSCEEFAKLMNIKASQLGLKHTHFVTPHGLDDEKHYTTAYELAILTDYALKNEKFRNIVETKNTNIYVNGNIRNISNTNELLGNIDGVYGVKTGFTFNAGRCLVSSCKRKNMDIIVVVLGADTKRQRTIDSVRAINYIFDNFEYIDIQNYVYNEFEIYKEYFAKNVNLYKTITKPEIEICETENFKFPLKTDDIQTLNSKFYCINKLSSSVEQNSKIGNLQICYNDKILCSYDVVLKNKLIKNNWWYYFKMICNFR